VREEAHFSWDDVEVGEDDRALVLRAIHSPHVWSDDDAWFNGGRADLSYGDEAVRVLLWLKECRRDDPGAARADDPSREVTIALDKPLSGRVPYDGAFDLVDAEGGAGRVETEAWSKVQVVGPSKLVVYWHGGMAALRRIDVKYDPQAITLTVMEEPPGRMAGRSRAAIVHLDEPLAGREIRDGAPPE
jgi:hypothetical protein